MACNQSINLSSSLLSLPAVPVQTTAQIYPYTSGGSGSTGACSSSILGQTVTGQAVQLQGTANYVYPSQVESTMMQAVAIAPTVIYIDARKTK